MHLTCLMRKISRKAGSKALTLHGFQIYLVYLRRTPLLGKIYHGLSEYAMTMYIYLFDGSLITVTSSRRWLFGRYRFFASPNSFIICVIVSSFQFWIRPSNAYRIQNLQVYRLLPAWKNLSLICGSYGTSCDVWCLVWSHASTFWGIQIPCCLLDDICRFSTSLDGYVRHFRIQFGVSWS